MSKKDRKTPFDKLNDLLLRPSTTQQDGKPFSEAYPGDFCSDLPVGQYLGEKKPPLPAGAVYDVREYGAVPNDKQRLATLGINYAISLCAKNGGGTVLVSGGDFYCQTIELKSGVTLFIEKGARLAAARETGGLYKNTLIYGSRLQGAAVTGGGTISGNGTFFSCRPERPPLTAPLPVIDAAKMERAYTEQLRPVKQEDCGSLIRLDDCRDVVVEHILLEDAGGIALRFCRCDRARTAHCLIQNNRHIAAAGGIGLFGTSHAEIAHSFISAGGDGVCLQNPLWMDCRVPMGHISIQDCEISTPRTAIHIGADTTADIFDVTVEGCAFRLTDIYPGMMSGVTVASCDGALVCDVAVKNIQMDGVACPLFVRLNNRNRAASLRMEDLPPEEQPKDAVLPASPERFDWRGSVRRVVFENVDVKNAELPVILAGVKEQLKGTRYAEQITLSNVEIRYRKCREVYDRRLFVPEYIKNSPVSWSFRNLPAYGIWARHVKGLHVRDFRCQPAQSTWKQCYSYDDVK